MKKYEIRKTSKEFTWKDRGEIAEGCTKLLDVEPESVGLYDTLEEARNALGKLETSVVKVKGWTSWLYEVTEYSIFENEYDEDGDLVDSQDIWETTEMPELDE